MWHTAFKPAIGGAPQNATTRMLLLVTKLHKNGVLSVEAKGRVKVCRLTTPPTFVLLASDAKSPGSSAAWHHHRGRVAASVWQRCCGMPRLLAFSTPETNKYFLDRRRCTRATLALSPRSTPSRLQPRSPKVHTHSDHKSTTQTTHTLHLESYRYLNPFLFSFYLEATWSTVEGTLLVLDGDSIQPSSKIASFDMVRGRCPSCTAPRG